MALDRRWFYLALFWLVNFSLGSFYAWSVYSSWLAEHYSLISQITVTASSLTFVFSIGAACNPVSMVAAGYLNDRFGPRIVLVVGGAVSALGYFLMSLSTDSSLLLIGYGICLGMGSGACVIATVSSAVKMFPEMRGLAGGSVGTSYGIGSVCLPPLANYLAQQFGIIVTLQIFAVACLIIIWTAASLVSSKALGKTGSAVSAQMTDELNWQAMIKTPRFYAMFALFIVGTLSPLMLFSQTVSIAREQVHLPLALAVLSVSILALANTSARLLAGALSDKIGRVNTLMISVMLAIVGLFFLSLSAPGQSGLFFTGLICIGACFGSCVGVFPSYTAEQFGPRNASMNYGILALAFSVAGILGPNIIQLTVQDGQYQAAYYTAMAISSMGLIAVYFCRKFERKLPTQ